MNETTKTERKFLLLDEDGRNIDVVATLRDSGTGAYFSLTSQNGIFTPNAASIPEDVRSDLFKLRAVHLAAADGTPMHALANSIYHMEQMKFTDAAKSLGVPNNAKDLIQIYAEIEDDLECEPDNGRPNPLDERLDAIKKAAEAVKKARVEFMANRGVGTFGRPEEVYLRSLMAYDRMRLTGKPFPLYEKIDGTIVKKQEKIKLFERKYPWVRETEAPAYLPVQAEKETIKKSVRSALLAKAVADYVERYCRPLWVEAAVEARRILALPDFKDARRPDPSVDPKTFEGWMANNGISFIVVRLGPSKSPEFKGGNDWTYTFTTKDGREFSDSFSTGSAIKSVTAASVLENLQMDCASIAYHPDRDQWLRDFGYDTDVKTLRKGEKAYDATVRIEAALKEFLGKEAYVALMTEAGDNPPLRAEDFEVEQTPPAP